MVSDQMTFFLSFTAVFAALGWYLWRLENEVGRLQERLRHATQQEESEQARGRKP